MEWETDSDALAFVGIIDHPRHVWVSGPLKVTMPGNGETSIGCFAGGVGLSRETVRSIQITGFEADCVVLIENLTSWHQWVAERASESELVIYTGVFPDRVVQLLLGKLVSSGAGVHVPVYHWGDMDVGGIRIFEYIRSKFFAQARPLGMNEEAFLQYAPSGLDISAAYAGTIEEMLDDGSFERWHRLLGLMLQTGKRVEQESVDRLPVLW